MAVLATDAFPTPGALSANWTTVSGQQSPTIASANVVQDPQAGFGDAVAFYNNATWPNDQYAQIAAIAGSGNYDGYVGPIVRTASGAETYYRVAISGIGGSAGTQQYSVEKIIAGAYTQIKGGTTTILTGDVVYLGVVGTTLTVKVNGATIDTATDASIASGSAGILASASFGFPTTVAQLGSFEGGSVDTPVVRTPTAGALSLAGGTMVVLAPRTATPTAGALTLAGGTATVVSTMAVVRTPTVGNLTLAGGTATVTATTGGGTTIAPQAGALTLTGGQPGVAFKGIDSGALALAGGTMTVIVNTAGSVTVAPSAGTLTLAGGTATLGRTFVTLPTVGALTLAGGTATVINGLSPVALPTAGSLSLAGGTPTVQLVQSIVATPTVGNLTLAGGTLTALVREPAMVQSGVLTLAGGRPRAINSGDVTTGGVPGGVLRYRYTLPDHPQQA